MDVTLDRSAGVARVDGAEYTLCIRGETQLRVWKRVDGKDRFFGTYTVPKHAPTGAPPSALYAIGRAWFAERLAAAPVAVRPVAAPRPVPPPRPVVRREPPVIRCARCGEKRPPVCFEPPGVYCNFCVRARYLALRAVDPPEALVCGVARETVSDLRVYQLRGRPVECAPWFDGLAADGYRD
jgi:hypothetical protein